ncbi:MATE efflux family protein [Gottschalkia acidurici 9a]|uniref:Probable multidrug resistance protein NorM n=1 Tax=Gottschalkia acidurici (strain ATCC 7906 / DSM 604 / BCRC 14475 / CIP 104303 / KCTC 5404 / NCIMB 10678 / 9a) TaxID=1128398 RepID=K0AVZ3_GOTA9|nr:MATE family efflux transporter [Gottschalkia acidurici]AFS77414.1 MATE efflux family protein [Gottschalkia acidurici 9a]
MEKEKQQVRGIRRDIFALAIPAILEMMLHTLVWTADTAMVGRLDPASISSVNLGSQMVFTISSILGGLGIGATALVARYIGANDKEKAERIATQSIGIGIIISLLIGITGILTSNMIFRNIVKDPEVVTLGTQYLEILFIGSIFLIPLLITNAIIRGSGNTVIPLISAVVANIFNIVWDYILIFGKFGFPRLEVRGAAIATAGSQLLGLTITLTFLMLGKTDIKVKLKNIFKFKLRDIKSIVNLSLPATLEVTMNEGSRLISAFWVAQLGTLAFSGHSLASAAESVSYMPGNGFTIATTALIGRSMGARNIDRAELTVKKSQKYAVIMMAAIAIIFFTIPYPIMRLYSNNLDSVSIAARCLRVGALEQIPIAIAMVYSGALKGAGDTKGPFKIALIINLFVRLPLIFIIVFIAKARIEYVWLATAMQYVAEAILMRIRYKRGRWKSISI